MKNISLLLVAGILFGFAPQPKPSKDLCGVALGEIKPTVSLGFLVSYSVEIVNNSEKVIDGVYWKATFIDNGKNVIREEDGSFNSTKNVFPIEPDTKRALLRFPRVKGATRVLIELKSVHFSDDSSCPESTK